MCVSVQQALLNRPAEMVMHLAKFSFLSLLTLQNLLRHEIKEKVSFDAFINASYDLTVCIVYFTFKTISYRCVLLFKARTLCEISHLQ